MRRLILCATLATALMFLATATYAMSFEDVRTETWVGTGSSEAMLVVDFGPESFAFGYRFDGTTTGYGMLNDIATQTDLDIVRDMDYAKPLVNTFSYHGYTLSYDSTTWSGNNWWEYWTSQNGNSWTSSLVGCGDRVVSDGDWDGWTFSDWRVASVAPGVPSLVPEPSALMGICSLIGFAASAKLLRRK